MPCLTSILSLDKSRAKRRQLFQKIFVDLADDYMNTESPAKKVEICKKIEELRREVVQTDLLLQGTIVYLREVTKWHSLPFTDDYLISFFKDYWANPEVDGRWSLPEGYESEGSEGEEDAK